jgi:hypothetical protein
MTNLCMGAGVTVHKILVNVFPPNDCFNIRVSFESRNGMKTGFAPLTYNII